MIEVACITIVSVCVYLCALLWRQTLLDLSIGKRDIDRLLSAHLTIEKSMDTEIRSLRADHDKVAAELVDLKSRDEFRNIGRR